MDSNGKYLTVSIVGQPVRRVLGIQVRFDADPGFTEPPPPGESIWSKCRSRFGRLSKQKFLFRSKVSGDKLLNSPIELEKGDDPKLSWGIGLAVLFIIGGSLFALLSSYDFSMGHSGATVSRQEAGPVVNSEPIAASASPSAADVSVAEESPLPLGINPTASESAAKSSEPGVQLVDANSTLPAAPMPIPELKAAQNQPEPKQPVKVVEKVVAVPVTVRKDVEKEKEKTTLLVDTSHVKAEEVAKAKPIAIPSKMTAIPDPKPVTLIKEISAVEVPPEKPAAQLAASNRDEKKITIVDIPKSNSYVLITDPKTRLPKKFVVGEAIFTGEVIKKIDASTGKVELNSRTIQME